MNKDQELVVQFGTSSDSNKMKIIKTEDSTDTTPGKYKFKFSKSLKYTKVDKNGTESNSVSSTDAIDINDDEQIKVGDNTFTTGSLAGATNIMTLTSNITSFKPFLFDTTTDKEGWYIDNNKNGKYDANDITNLTSTNMTNIADTGVQPYGHALQMTEGNYNSKKDSDFKNYPLNKTSDGKKYIIMTVSEINALMAEKLKESKAVEGTGTKKYYIKEYPSDFDYPMSVSMSSDIIGGPIVNNVTFTLDGAVNDGDKTTATIIIDRFSIYGTDAGKEDRDTTPLTLFYDDSRKEYNRVGMGDDRFIEIKDGSLKLSNSRAFFISEYSDKPY